MCEFNQMELIVRKNLRIWHSLKSKAKMKVDEVIAVYTKIRYPGRSSLVPNRRTEYYKNNTFAVNHIMLSIVHETGFGFLRQSGSRPSLRK
jgi:hypothetical protein